MNKHWVRGIAAAAVIAAGTPAHAATINLVDLGGVSGSAAEQGFNIAKSFWEATLTNNVTLNFGVGYAALEENVIGQTGSASQVYSIANWRSGVVATQSASALDQSLVLPTLAGAGSGIRMITSGGRSGNNGVNANANARVYDTSVGTTANANNNRFLDLNTTVVKAIGGAATYDADNTLGLDAEITFSSTFNFDFNPTNGIDLDAFDFIATAIHEMGHALGFVSGVDTYDYIASLNAAGNIYNLNQYAVFSALDMFRYSQDPTNLVAGSGPVLDFAVGAPAYFSIDGGVTQLFGNSLFATGYYRGDGDQASHFKDAPGCSGQIGIMDPTECFGQLGEITMQDLAAFDAIGWNIDLNVLANPALKFTTASIYDRFAPTAAVPEPTSWAMLIGGFGLVGGALRRRRVSVAYA